MGADDHLTVRPTNWNGAEGSNDEFEGLEEIEVPPPMEPEDRLYHVWMAPICKSIQPTPHLPTFLYVRARSDVDAEVKKALMGEMMNGIRCPCQIRLKRAELWV